MIKQVGNKVFCESIVNAHSHGFQYAMAGLAEYSSNQSDSFWTWRDSMYRLVSEMNLDKFAEINRKFLTKCLESGYGHVVEFHYLHHVTNDPLDTVKCLYDLASDVGIGMTVVPVFYHSGGFEQKIKETQKRFYFESPTKFLNHVEACSHLIPKSGNHRLGYGVHSLRACPIKWVKEITSAFHHLPFHIHLSEQVAEVRECVKHYGKPPTQLFLEEQGDHPNMHLVHATNVSDEELHMIVDQNAHVVICPTTEANLGDGYFPLRKFLRLGGKFSIGSDSHVTVNPWEEMRWLDYQDRLQHQDRLGLFDAKPEDYRPELLYKAVLDGGKAAAGVAGSYLEDYFLGPMDSHSDLREHLAKKIYVS